MRFSVFAFTTLAAVLAFVSTASANPSGLPGYTGKPNLAAPAGETCNKCHGGGTANAPSSVVLTGPATLAAGQVAQYSLVVSTTKPRAAAGIAATDGIELTAVSNLQESFMEMVQGTTGGTAPSGGKVTFTFTVKAPLTGTAIKLWASGLASDNTGGNGGDSSRQATMDIAITGGSMATDAGADASSSGSSGTISDGGSSGSSGASSSGSSGASNSSSSGSSGSTSGGEEDAGSTASSSGDTLPNDEAGGCNVSGNEGYGSALFLGAISMIPLLARRRRAKT